MSGGVLLKRYRVVSQTRETVAGLSPDSSKTATVQNLSVRLHRDCVHCTAGRVRIERVRHAGDRIEPRDEPTCLPADGEEDATGQDLSVRLHRNCKNLAVWVWIEGISQTAGWIDAGNIIAALATNG